MANYSEQFGIQKFYSQAINRGFARDYQFRVLSMGDWLDASDILYLASGSIPGRTINSIAVPYIGLNFQVPGAANYNSNAGWRVSFRCDETLNIRNKLEDWSRSIFNDVTTKGTTIPDDTNDNNIQLVAIDNLGNERKKITLKGAWVQTVGDLTYSLGGTGAVVTCDAIIAYQFWTEDEGSRVNIKPSQPYDRGALI